MSKDVNYYLHLLNLIVGGTVVLNGLYKYFSGSKNNIPLYIALAIIIVGPIEDWLNKLIDNLVKPEDRQQFIKKFIDQLTSFIFIIFLGFILIES
ncbi:MAG: hypothetical protein PWQ67_951 [Clostridia bacterium]|jgi:hypothetical protein|nr:hypothetical protein [Clostridia bacterium]MDN5322497.1 hypothetical protein [Clostridia bacterium]